MKFCIVIQRPHTSFSNSSYLPSKVPVAKKMGGEGYVIIWFDILSLYLLCTAPAAGGPPEQW